LGREEKKKNYIEDEEDYLENYDRQKMVNQYQFMYRSFGQKRNNGNYHPTQRQKKYSRFTMLICKLCGVKGHLEDNCNQKQVCIRCGSTEHNEETCDRKYCKKCNNIGHSSKQCEVLTLKPLYCIVCGEDGHYPQLGICSEIKSSLKLSCPKCGGSHRLNDCPETKPTPTHIHYEVQNPTQTQNPTPTHFHYEVQNPTPIQNPRKNSTTNITKKRTNITKKRRKTTNITKKKKKLSNLSNSFKFCEVYNTNYQKSFLT